MRAATPSRTGVDAAPVCTSTGAAVVRDMADTVCECPSLCLPSREAARKAGGRSARHRRRCHPDIDHTDTPEEHVTMTMTTTTSDSNPAVRNGVDTAAFFATLDAVKGNHDIADFQWRVSNTWIDGAHNRSTISGFYGATQEQTHRAPFHL